MLNVRHVKGCKLYQIKFEKLFYYNIGQGARLAQLIPTIQPRILEVSIPLIN